jgi:hypothetical protein
MKQLLLIFWIMFLVVSCDSPTSKQSELPTEIDTKVLLPSKAEIIKGRVEVIIGPEDFEPLSFDYQYFDTAYQTKGQRKVNSIVLELMKLDKKKKPVATEVNEQLFKDHLEYFKSEYRKFREESEYDMVWYLNITIDLDTTYSNLIQMTFGEEGFAGGAHGWITFKTILVDDESGQVLKLSSIVGDEDRFNDFALYYFLKQNGLNSLEEAEMEGYWFDEGFKCSENFYFSEKSMVFQYNQYEIAPYAMGMPLFEIPLSDLKNRLKIELKQSK